MTEEVSNETKEELMQIVKNLREEVTRLRMEDGNFNDKIKYLKDMINNSDSPISRKNCLRMGCKLLKFERQYEKLSNVYKKLYVIPTIEELLSYNEEDFKEIEEPVHELFMFIKEYEKLADSMKNIKERIKEGIKEGIEKGEGMKADEFIDILRDISKDMNENLEVIREFSEKMAETRKELAAETQEELASSGGGKKKKSKKKRKSKKSKKKKPKKKSKKPKKKKIKTGLTYSLTN